MKYYYSILLLLNFLFISCSNKLSDEEFSKVNLVDGKVYVEGLYYEVVQFGRPFTNLREFDIIVWEKFYGASGVYELVALDLRKDKYGNEYLNEEVIGQISFDELSKFQNSDFFNRANGLFSIVTF